MKQEVGDLILEYVCSTLAKMEVCNLPCSVRICDLVPTGFGVRTFLNWLPSRNIQLCQGFQRLGVDRATASECLKQWDMMFEDADTREDILKDWDL